MPPAKICSCGGRWRWHWSRAPLASGPVTRPLPAPRPTAETGEEEGVGTAGPFLVGHLGAQKQQHHALLSWMSLTRMYTASVTQR